MASSRGNAISAYLAPFSKGALIYGANIQSGVITSAHIKDGTVLAADVGAGAITSAKLGVSAVTTTKIQVNAVRAAHISANAVTSAKLGTASVTNAKMKAAFLSGTLVSGRTTRAIAHGLGVKPKSVIVVALPTLTQANISASATANMIFLAAASAATSANFYVIGTQAANAALKYAAYVQI